MNRFNKLSHAVWSCSYHIVWTPKYRYRILKGEIKNEVEKCIRTFSEQKKCVLTELNIQEDHVHLLVQIPPKLSISDYMGIIKGRTAIRIFGKFKHLKCRPYWGNSFWAKGYCVDTVGLNEEMIRKYVKYQEEKDKRNENR
ncbi:IS200/IS605 family transposase [Aureibacter tunicatorum]|uniref:Transposase n=1 Tax=Aureibacter tunicatorum TaxID=866807 RepID=A0AAE4BT59_9BACT|nr:IS200/IS605 family transposase [Aureibacter tunicatorum]MDR6239518.1 putative transposase [Aureibacter tunicatorum]BDD03995.1 IS200/IS605 family transposase [Aureibacter tunicatorum]